MDKNGQPHASTGVRWPFRKPVAALFAAALLFAVGGTGQPARAAVCTTQPRLTGSFIQPDLPDGMSSAWWNSELGYMQNACLSQLVLQWSANSALNDTTYPTSLPGWHQGTATDVVGGALTAADARVMSVYVGLQTNPDWFRKHADDATWLSGQATIANQIADEIWQRYGSHSSFAGWYLPFEVDNFYFTTTTSWDNLVSFFQTVMNHVHTLSPGKPIITSPFFNASGGQTTSQWQTMWTNILQRSTVDVIALQDGVGVGHATAGQLPPWFAATKNAINAGRPATQLWADTETLNLDLKSAAINDVVTDMQAVQPYVSNYLSFSYNHYDSPNQVANEYDWTYRDYLTNGVVESTPPTIPGTPTATPINSITINLSWGASTDNIGVVGYKIYRNGQFVWTQYTVSTNFSDSQLNPSTAYSYTVAAFDAAGNVSAQSASATTSTPPGITYPTNLAVGKPYVATLAADPAYPDSGTKLTDGVYAVQPPLLSDPAWQGRNTGNIYSFTIDLGTVQPIKEINSDWFQYKGASIFLPAQVIYSVSTNGVTFTTAGTIARPAVTEDIQSKKYRLIDLSNVSGRYVKIAVTPPSAAWTFIDEAEARQ
jgi:chitodextrinase